MADDYPPLKNTLETSVPVKKPFQDSEGKDQAFYDALAEALAEQKEVDEDFGNSDEDKKYFVSLKSEWPKK